MWIAVWGLIVFFFSTIVIGYFEYKDYKRRIKKEGEEV